MLRERMYQLTEAGHKWEPNGQERKEESVLDYPDYRLSFEEDRDDELHFTSAPAVRKSQLGRRLSGYRPAVLTPKQEAVVDTQQMQALTIAAREHTAKAATETKGELFLHTNMVFGECVSQAVDLKDGIVNPEKKKLYANFAQRMVNKLPDALEHGFDVANDEIDRVGETDLSTLVSPPDHQEEEADEYVDVRFRDWVQGKKRIERKERSRRRR